MTIKINWAVANISKYRKCRIYAKYRAIFYILALSRILWYFLHVWKCVYSIASYSRL